MKKKTKRLTPQAALKIGRLSRAERAKARRRAQNRRAAQVHRDRLKAEKMKLRLRAPSTWVRPPFPPVADPAGPEYGKRIPADPEESIRKPRRRSRPPRRAVRAEPSRGVQDSWRGGESARSWGLGKGGGTKVPFDVADFLREEF